MRQKIIVNKHLGLTITVVSSLGVEKGTIGVATHPRDFDRVVEALETGAEEETHGEGNSGGEGANRGGDSETPSGL